MSHNFGACDICQEYTHRIREADENGLYVTAIPPQATSADLYQYFSQYGKIQDFHFADNGVYCLLSYDNRRSTWTVLDNPGYFYGRIMSMRPRKPSRQVEEDTEDDLSAIHPERIIAAISLKADFKSQIKELVSLLEVGADWPDMYQMVCRDVETTLNSSLPGCKALPFGSSVSGLAFKGSDVDIYLQKASDKPKVGSMEAFGLAEKAISGNTSVFTNISSIAHARVPIIKFVHKSTGIKCDLSFKNLFGVQNSKLLRYLMSLDDRIKPLLVTVKYWAKIHKLTGKRMSNYAMSLLVVSFLQTLSDPVLPPICKLQHKDLPVLDIDGWNANFDDDVTKLRPVSNNLSLEELLCRFFEKVATSNFDDIVLCPLVGNVITKACFDSLTLPHAMNNYKRLVQSHDKPRIRVDCPLCIQDHAELNINVTQGVRPLSLQCLKEHCSIAAKICHSAPVNHLLQQLLSPNFTRRTSDLTLTNGVIRNPVRSTMTIHIPHVVEERKDDVEELSVTWRDKMYDLIIKGFIEVLKLDVETVTHGMESERKPGSNRSLRCRGHKILWRCRDILWERWKEISNQERQPAKNTSSECNKEEDITIVHVSEKNSDKVTVIDLEGDKKNDQEESIITHINDVTKQHKRKLDSEGNSENSKAKKQCVGNSSHDTEVEIVDDGNSHDSIVLDSEPQVDVKHSRTLQEEIQLSSDMVRKEHAKSANHTILNFECILSKEKSGIRIEIADRRSREIYFSSLCIYLEEHLPNWLLVT